MSSKPSQLPNKLIHKMAPEMLPKAIGVFITRSKELSKADSLISYFCEFL
jgi:hypothetical protein